MIANEINEATSNEISEATGHPLTPMQQGMLFNSLYSPDSGVEIEQMICTLDEDLNVSALMRAWEDVVARHDILRVGYRWKGIAEPLQQVGPRVALPWESHDLRRAAPAEQQRRLDEYISADRRRGFDLSAAPVMRFALFCLGEESYRLVWTIHHSLIDLRGFIVTFREVFALYEAYARGAEVELPEPGRYWDYVDWVTRRADHAASSERFWRGALEGFDSPTPLPQGLQRSDAGAPSAGDFGEVSGSLSEETTARLKSLAAESGITLSVFVLGAWALLLSRYSGEKDVVFGTTRTCRRWGHSTEADWSVGLFVSTVPFRARVPEDATLLEWLGELRASWSAAARHVHTPLTMIREWSRMRRGAPLFESILVHAHEELNTTLRALGGDWSRRSVRIINQTGFPLTLASYGEEKLLLRLKYDALRFGQEVPARLLEQLLTILRETAENPSRKVSSLTFLTDEELRRQLVEWNDTAFTKPHGRCVHELVEEHAAKAPDALAVVCERERLSYAELNERANRLAHHLRRLGVGPETRVGVLMSRGTEMVVSLLAILKAGGAYVPLDPEYPRERLGFMLEDAGIEFLITFSHLRERLDASGVQTFCLDTDWQRVAAGPCEDPRPLALAGNAAYVIYTSGSTGAPKGVVVSHESLMNLAAWNRRVCGLVGSDRATLTAGVAFDASVLELWPCLAAGASLHVPDEETRAVPEELLRWHARQGITVSFMTTPLAEALMAEAEPDGLVLRVLQTGGDRLRSRGGATRSYALLNLYGPTECTVLATCASVSKGEGGTPTIGRPIANTQVYVLDGALELLPVGAQGELYVGGVAVARGYLNRPSLTAERFIPDPFSLEAGGRLYRTGDVVRWLADGELEFIGRADNQVKVRGFRIELGEIETALAAHDSVRDCIVLAREDEPGDKRLVAYVVAADGGRSSVVISAAELRAFLKERLPEYMVPSAFVMLEALPINANGKVDRKALPEPDSSWSAASEYVAPRDEVEEALCEVWAEVLRVARVGVHDNFFELGGHSLKATQVVSRLRRDMQVTLPVRSLFASPTVAEFAPLVESTLLEEIGLMSEEEAECMASE